MSSTNSMLAALNQFLIFKGLGRLRLKRLRVQQRSMRDMDRELKGGVPQTGAHRQIPGKGAAGHDHGDDLRHGDLDQ